MSTSQALKPARSTPHCARTGRMSHSGTKAEASDRARSSSNRAWGSCTALVLPGRRMRRCFPNGVATSCTVSVLFGWEGAGVLKARCGGRGGTNPRTGGVPCPATRPGRHPGRRTGVRDCRGLWSWGPVRRVSAQDVRRTGFRPGIGSPGRFPGRRVRCGTCGHCGCRTGCPTGGAGAGPAVGRVRARSWGVTGSDRARERGVSDGQGWFGDRWLAAGGMQH